VPRIISISHRNLTPEHLNKERTVKITTPIRAVSRVAEPIILLGIAEHHNGTDKSIKPARKVDTKIQETSLKQY